jgi:hypothetical protein
VPKRDVPCGCPKRRPPEGFFSSTGACCPKGKSGFSSTFSSFLSASGLLKLVKREEVASVFFSSHYFEGRGVNNEDDLDSLSFLTKLFFVVSEGFPNSEPPVRLVPAPPNRLVYFSDFASL